MLKLFPEEEQNERAWLALTRFLDALDDAPLRESVRPALEPLVLSFQLKLLWVSGLLPHVDACVGCGASDGLFAYSPSASGAVCRDCDTDGLRLSPSGISGIEGLLTTPIADAPALSLDDARAARRAPQ